MTTPRSRLLACVAALAALIATLTLTGMPAAQATASAGKRPGSPPGKPITVMTRNLYLGADIQRPITAAMEAGEDPVAVLLALAHATHDTRPVVDQTNFNVRARLLAREIKHTKPDLIGLQEVAWWRHGDIQLDQLGVPNATETDYDFLQILLAALRARGERYLPVSVAPRADVEAPSFTGNPYDGTMSDDAQDVRLTMRDVVLMRAGSALRVTGTGEHIYGHNLSIKLPGATLQFDRGYQWVDVRAGATRFRFINTHLEAFRSDLAYAQAAELLAGAVKPGSTNILVCDCNSDPLNHSIKGDIGDTQPHSAPYDLITGTGTGGFYDEWLRWAPAEQGWTSGLSETVNDPTAAGFDHRIDMVFARSANGGPLLVDRGTVTGTKLTDRDPATGLWPSDHGGVVLRLRGVK